MGNKIKDSRYWKKEEKRKYRICEEDRGTSEYVWENYQRKEERSGWQENVGWVLKD